MFVYYILVSSCMEVKFVCIAICDQACKTGYISTNYTFSEIVVTFPPDF